MADADLEKYLNWAIERGVTEAKLISPGSVVTAPWVDLKAHYGAPSYNRNYSAPPETPAWNQTRLILDCYRRAVLFRLELRWELERDRRLSDLHQMLRDLEGELFKDGFYKAFIFLSSDCNICLQCNKPRKLPCAFPLRSRPAMEACGIDVFQTARDNGFILQTLKERTETQSRFCLMLVD